MKILIVGFGKMGRAIEQTLIDRGIKDYKKIDPVDPAADFASLLSVENPNEYIAVDFSHPNAIMENIEWYADNKVDAVIGTTNWGNELPMVEKLVANAGTKLIYSANFSETVQMFFFINKLTAKLANARGGFDASINEIHHNAKADVSGTAKALAKDIEGKSEILYGVTGPKGDNAVTIASERLAGVFGEHTVRYAKQGDRIELFHHADGRTGFAAGAIDAAEMMPNLKPGTYNYADLLKEKFTEVL
jgi:4-hydroxy-tetrahydrodipicolinate reductase